GASIGYEGKNNTEDPILVVKDRAVSALSNIISGFDEITDETQRIDGVLLVIDEIHNLRDIDGAAQILRAISTTLDVNRLGKISFMIIGYPEGVERFFAGDPSARRHFDILDLSPMPREEAKEILAKGFESIHLNYDEKEMDKRIDVAGGYPHSIQMIGHYLVDLDQDGNIDGKDWEKALKKSAEELARKDFSEMYDFKGKGTLRETVLNILALEGKPLSKQKLRDLTEGKNIYTKTCLGELKRSGAVKEMPDGMVALHSMLFRAAILVHIYTKANDDKAYSQMIRKYVPTDSQITM
ncbi:PyrBI operon leader peptide, partial [mine drainage metagenome]